MVILQRIGVARRPDFDPNSNPDFNPNFALLGAGFRLELARGPSRSRDPLRSGTQTPKGTHPVRFNSALFGGDPPILSSVYQTAHWMTPRTNHGLTGRMLWTGLGIPVHEARTDVLPFPPVGRVGRANVLRDGHRLLHVGKGTRGHPYEAGFVLRDVHRLPSIREM